MIALLIMTEDGAGAEYDKLSPFLLPASFIIFSRNSFHVYLSEQENQFSHLNLVGLGGCLRKVFLTAVQTTASSNCVLI